METELFMHYAEIAGVFVGFGALISMRSARPADLHDVVYLRGLLVVGVGVVVNALLPITVSRYGVQDHALWRSCALAALTLWVTLVIVYWRTPDSKAFSKEAERIDKLFPVVGLPLHLTIAGSFLLIILGVHPGIDEALSVTALTAGVIFAGYTLLVMVMSQGHAAAPHQEDRPQREVD
jgi:hypothetical protein